MTAIQQLCSTSSSYQLPWNSTLKFASQQSNTVLTATFPLGCQSPQNRSSPKQLGLHKQLCRQVNWDSCTPPLDTQTPDVKSLSQKYLSYMKRQNKIIDQVLMQTKTKQPIQQHLSQRLKQTSNQFIKNLLKQLTQIYTKYRVLRSTTKQQIQHLQSSLQHQKSQTKSLITHYQLQLQTQSDNLTTQTHHLQHHHQSQLHQYQQKYLTLLSQLQNRQQHIQKMQRSQKMNEQKMRELNKILRCQQDKCNEKYKEIKGLEILVGEYQGFVEDVGREKEGMMGRIGVLEGRVREVQKYNAQLIAEIQNIEKQLQNKQQQISKLTLTLQQSRSTSTRYLQQLQTQTQSHTEYKTITDNKLLTSKNTQTSLNLQLQSLKSTLTSTQTKLAQKIQQLISKQEEFINYEMSTKKYIEKMKEMYGRREKIVKKLFVKEIKELRGMNQRVREELAKEVFRFYYGVKTEMVMSLQEVKENSNCVTNSSRRGQSSS